MPIPRPAPADLWRVAVGRPIPAGAVADPHGRRPRVERPVGLATARGDRHEAASTGKHIRSLQQPVQPLGEGQRRTPGIGDGRQRLVWTPVRHRVPAVGVADDIHRRVRQPHRGDGRELIHVDHVRHHETRLAVQPQQRHQRRGRSEIGMYDQQRTRICRGPFAAARRAAPQCGGRRVRSVARPVRAGSAMRRRRWACALNEARRVESSQITCTANTIDTRRTRDRHHSADNRQAWSLTRVDRPSGRLWPRSWRHTPAAPVRPPRRPPVSLTPSRPAETTAPGCRRCPAISCWPPPKRSKSTPAQGPCRSTASRSAVKDSIDVEGVPTTLSCPGYAYVVSSTARSVLRDRLRCLLISAGGEGPG